MIDRLLRMISALCLMGLLALAWQGRGGVISTPKLAMHSPVIAPDQDVSILTPRIPPVIVKTTAVAPHDSISDDTLVDESITVDDTVVDNVRTARVYPEFPAVMTRSRWVPSTAGIAACTTKPEHVWSFGLTPTSRGWICKPRGASTYQCQTERGYKTREFVISPGHFVMGDYIMDRPHITLSRVGRPHRLMGLQLCPVNPDAYTI